jgi:hypothetical protein
MKEPRRKLGISIEIRRNNKNDEGRVARKEIA